MTIERGKNRYSGTLSPELAALLKDQDLRDVYANVPFSCSVFCSTELHMAGGNKVFTAAAGVSSYLLRWYA